MFQIQNKIEFDFVASDEQNYKEMLHISVLYT